MLYIFACILGIPEETLKAPMANQASSMISRKPQLFNTTSSSQHLNAGRDGVPKDEEKLGFVFFVWLFTFDHGKITIKLPFGEYLLLFFTI